MYIYMYIYIYIYVYLENMTSMGMIVGLYRPSKEVLFLQNIGDRTYVHYFIDYLFDTFYD